MIKLHKVRWKNFLSTGNQFTEVQLDDCSTTLICGENGSGKSTLMDAICFSLFSKPFRKINKPQLINAVTNKNMVCEIEFETNNKQYKIVRGIKPTVFEIYQDDKLINESADMRDYQQIVESNILKMSYKTFCQIVILGNANFTPFMQLSAAQRREIIEDLLDIQVFSTMNVLLKEIIQQNKQEIIDINYQIKMITNAIEIKKHHHDQLTETHKSTIDNKQKQIRKIIATNKTLEQKIQTMSEKTAAAQHAIDRAKSKLANAIESVTQTRAQIDHKLEQAHKLITFYQTNTQCPTCTQEILESFKHQCIDNNRQTVDTLENERKVVECKIEQVNKKVEQINQALVTLNANINTITSMQTQVQLNTKTIHQLQEEINETIHPTSTESLDNDYAKLKSVEKEFVGAVEKRELYNVASLLLKDSGIKGEIIKQYIPIINQLINKYLDKMEFFCQFEINQQFEESIKSRYRDEFTYTSFSEGEKMRIDLALLFTWREIAKIRNSASCNLLVLDEIMDSSLDNNGTEDFIRIISEVTDRSNIMIISHKHEQINDKFDKVIRFEKVKNFSRIAQ